MSNQIFAGLNELGNLFPSLASAFPSPPSSPPSPSTYQQPTPISTPPPTTYVSPTPQLVSPYATANSALTANCSTSLNSATTPLPRATATRPRATATRPRAMATRPRATAILNRTSTGCRHHSTTRSSPGRSDRRRRTRPQVLPNLSIDVPHRSGLVPLHARPRWPDWRVRPDRLRRHPGPPPPGAVRRLGRSSEPAGDPTGPGKRQQLADQPGRVTGRLVLPPGDRSRRSPRAATPPTRTIPSPSPRPPAPRSPPTSPSPTAASPIPRPRQGRG